MHRLALALLLLVGCATSPPPVPAPDATVADAYVRMTGELRAAAAFYDREVRKNHTKARVMSVFAGVAATGAGASIGVLAQPGLDDEIRPGITAAGISSAVMSGLLAILPFAHQYRLKELGYARQADAAWTALHTIEASCAGVFPAGDPADQQRCAHDVAEALTAARTFPEDSPCRPPPR
ncbi:MAG: hypothetical protein GY898_24230 [Proteobacteria bacterium]|nr:hypothetical protein [Pseudomonadota bacterium]